MSRRRFLFGGAAAAAGVALGGGLLVDALWGKKPAYEGLRQLTDAERATVVALAEAYFPGEKGLPSVHEIDIASRVDSYLIGLPGSLGRLTQVLIRTFEWSTAVGTRHLTRFSLLPLEERQRVVDDWEGSSLYARRMGFLTLKLAVAQGYFDDDRVREAMGWTVPCLKGQMKEWL